MGVDCQVESRDKLNVTDDDGCSKEDEYGWRSQRWVAVAQDGRVLVEKMLDLGRLLSYLDRLVVMGMDVASALQW